MDKFTIEKFFTKEWEKEIPEIAMTAIMYKHKTTKAEVLYLKNSDTNKLFSITFKTIPSDSTGVAHILEHSVLNGSKKYRIKEPFTELLKNSLKTYLNAMTFFDKTSYPVASENAQDLYNLSDVYLDAVFNPLLKKEVFQQEGWHYELKDPSEPLKIKGVVFNEMKGALSTLEFLLAITITKALLPGTPYKYEFGGNPENVPELTYEDFVAFHKQYYHPSNAKFFLYGNLDIERHLQHIQEYIGTYKFKQTDEIVKQRPFTEVKIQEQQFAADKNRPIDEQGVATCSWLFIEDIAKEELIGLEILSYLLVLTEASPLKKALLASGLGQSFLEFGFDRGTIQPTFVVGLKGVKVTDFEKVEDLVTSVLNELSIKIDKNLIDGAINSVEFARKEELGPDSDSKPVVYMIRALESWGYGRDPLDNIQFAESIKSIREKYKSGYFEKLIKKYFLDNLHRVNLRFVPDEQLAEEKENNERELLAKYKENLSIEEQKQIIRETNELERIQQQKNNSSDLAKLPMLAIKDLNRDITKFPVSIDSSIEDVEIIQSKYRTNGVIYLQFAFDISKISLSERHYIELFALSILKMGTKEKSFEELHLEIDKYTGGVDYNFYSGIIHSQGKKSINKLVFTVKVLEENVEIALSLLEDMFNSVNLNQKKRFKQIVSEFMQEKEESLVEDGHLYAIQRAKSSFSALSAFEESTTGSSAYALIKSEITTIDSNWEKIYESLTRLHKQIINRNGLIIHLTSNGKEKVLDTLKNFIKRIPKEKFATEISRQLDIQGDSVVIIPAAINFVAEVQDLSKTSFKMQGAYIAMSSAVNLNYLWNEVRVKGGAYGAMYSLDGSQKLLSLVSYRDPNIEATFDVYAGLGKYLRTITLSKRDITGLIIGAIGKTDPYLTPEEKGSVAFDLYLRQVPDSYRQKLRDELFALSTKDIRDFGSLLNKVTEEDKSHVVFGNESSIKKYVKESKKNVKIVNI